MNDSKFSLVPDVRPVLAHREGDRQVFGARPRRHQLQVTTGPQFCDCSPQQQHLSYLRYEFYETFHHCTYLGKGNGPKVLGIQPSCGQCHERIFSFRIIQQQDFPNLDWVLGTFRSLKDRESTGNLISGSCWSTSARTRSSAWSPRSFRSRTKSWRGDFLFIFRSRSGDPSSPIPFDRCVFGFGFGSQGRWIDFFIIIEPKKKNFLGN